MFCTVLYSQSDFDWESFKYDIGFNFIEDVDSIFIPYYSNGIKTANLYSSNKERLCDSIIKYHPNGKISAVGKLLNYTIKFDSLMAENVYSYWYRAKLYYENGALAKSVIATDRVHEYKLFSEQGQRLTEYKRVLDIIEYGCAYEEHDIEIGKFKFFIKNKVIGTVYFTKEDMKVIKLKTDNCKLSKNDFRVSIFNDEYYCLFPLLDYASNPR